MVQRTELETTIRRMVANDILSKPLSSLGQKAARRRDSLSKEAERLLRTGARLDLERAFVRMERTSEEKARTMREGIEAFQETHPRYGAILEGLIKEKRLKNNTQLVYGIANGFNLGLEEYRGVMRDLGMSTRQADAMYTHLLDISEQLGKAGEYEERTILL
ncbi:MAG: hypothetical protein Q8Q42_03830 [Nanoarchaeota archaeon]|nr:hypothetical protein [Nanoarchaeota archaeon]